MAVVQISRIQQRRGKKNSNTGLPQLASGELAWCIDTQELYIGNGSVAEGAPTVGNTKILTAKDLADSPNILSNMYGEYKYDSYIRTGTNANHPVLSSIQNKLDETVTAKDFGIKANAIDDDTMALQRAINQLFLNANGKASDSSLDYPLGTVAASKQRVSLKIPEGIYNISSTIYIPSYTSLFGAGIDKTIIQFSGTGPVFKFINDSSFTSIESDIVTPSTIDSTTSSNQPRFIVIKDLSIITTTDQDGFQLDAVRNSEFENIRLQGAWNGNTNLSKGLNLRSLSSLITCEQNIFKNIQLSNFSYAIYSKYDISKNIFDVGYVSNTRQGIVLGYDSTQSSIGQQVGPSNTSVNNYKFYNIKQHAIFVDFGNQNSFSNIVLSNVGNDGGSDAKWPQLYFATYTNIIDNIMSDRFEELSNPSNLIPFIPIVAGHASYTSSNTTPLAIGYITGYNPLVKLPVSTNSVGTPSGSITYKIEYFYKSTTNFFTRNGTLTISADISNGKLQLSDDYDYAGADPSGENSLKLDFRVVFLDQSGNSYTTGETPYTIVLLYTNTLSNDSGTFVYTFSALS